ncbi:MAG TPA: GNAT family N-acetyltransferase [Longimicrobium sp.]|nr:GNAT family N-acetyltransferase [Longimicrobium sp.]
MSTPEPQTVVIESPRLLIRALRPGDEARLQAVFAAAPDWHLATGRPEDPNAAAHEIAGSAADPGRAVAVLTLREGGEDVGAIGWWLNRPEPGMALLGTLVVASAHRGQGLAREALDALEAWLSAAGVAELRTAFPRRLFPLHSLVKSLGFLEMSIAEHQKLGLPGAGTALWQKALGPR